jgi:DNA-binding IclR family transcriptional regulator
MPASTTWRIAQSLVISGYLLYDDALRKYRLAASVLALGYGAARNSELQRSTLEQMQACADLHAVHISLRMRDRLDLIIQEQSAGAGAQIPLILCVGVRMGIASSPLGWVLPAERCLLLFQALQRSQHKDS